MDIQDKILSPDFSVNYANPIYVFDNGLHIGVAHNELELNGFLAKGRLLDRDFTYSGVDFTIQSKKGRLSFRDSEDDLRKKYLELSMNLSSIILFYKHEQI